MHQDNKTTLFGFWVYLMTDFILFAGLFAVYIVFRGSAVSPTGTTFFSAPYVLIETIALLTSSFTCGLALVASQRHKVREMLLFLVITFALGALFVGMEVFEFAKLVSEGYGPSASGFLSSYFALVGTHGLHVTIGLLWLLALMFAVSFQGLTSASARKVALFALFWHFLDVIWIFIFTIVYLFGFL